MRNSKLRQLFGKQHKDGPYGIGSHHHWVNGELVESEPTDVERGQIEDFKSQLTPVHASVEDDSHGADGVLPIDCSNNRRSRLPARSDGDFLKKSNIVLASNTSRKMTFGENSIMELLMAENILYHKPDLSFHQAHMNPGIFTPHGFKQFKADVLILLRSWVIAYEFLNDPDFIIKYVPGKTVPRKRKRALPISTPIFPCLLLPSTAPSSVKKRNMEFQKQLKNASGKYNTKMKMYSVSTADMYLLTFQMSSIKLHNVRC